MDTFGQFQNPLINRYATKEMVSIWSSENKFRLWRQMWTWLAECQMELGLPIQEEQLAEMRENVDCVDLTAASSREAILKHDVMSHLAVFSDQCSNAKPIIHLGATSCFVTDNTELILIRESLLLLKNRLRELIEIIAKFCSKYRATCCLGWTHLQPAQLTTVGKRACLWLSDLLLDFENIDRQFNSLKARAAKGATGTQASFLFLFDGDEEKVKQLDQRLSVKMGFQDCYKITGQTYSRKVDSMIADALSGVNQSALKIGNDLRILAQKGELKEAVSTYQVGSSAMPYKRNPLTSERVCGLARFAISIHSNFAFNTGLQFLERTLDDSSNRRLALPQIFLATSSVVELLRKIFSSVEVDESAIEDCLQEELPFIVTEKILMAAAKKGFDRQEYHEKIRVHALRVSADKGKRDLLELLSSDPSFDGLISADILDPNQHIGRAVQQVDELLKNEVADLGIEIESH